MDYYSTTTPSTTDLGGALAGFFAVMGVFVLVAIAIAIVCVIANYKLFKKMNMEGWKSLIPGANIYLLLEAVGIDQKWLLIIIYGAIISCIPILGFLVYMIAAIYFFAIVCGSLAKSFGKSTGFAVGLFFLGPIFTCILAFGSSSYLGATPVNDIIFKKKDNTQSPATPTPAAVDNANAATGKVCPQCGAAVSGDSAFCVSCGSKVD